MRQRIRVLTLIALCAVFTSRCALAWNSIGHMTVAWVAYQQLTPAERSRAATLLALNPYFDKWKAMVPAGSTEEQANLYIFMMAATWPDEIKAEGSGYTGNNTPPAGELPSLNDGYEDKQAHKYWHFVDQPFGKKGLTLPPIPEPNITEKITVLRAALATDEPDALKSYDLVWLLHLVGDLHQPLHATTRVTSGQPKGDQGGNLVTVKTSAKELHAFWDNALGEGQTKDFAKAAAIAPTLPPADPDKAKDDKEADWAAESFALAKSTVYRAPIGLQTGPYKMTAAYTARTKKVSEQQVSLAGARLATLLKEAFACTDQSCAH